MKYLILIITVLLVISCAAEPKPQLFSVDLNSRNIRASEVEAYFDPYLSIGSVKKRPVSVYYYPDTDAVCLQFKVQFVSCNQFWDKEGRDAFVAAFKRYQEDYEQKKLVIKGRKARDAYGKVDGFFAWKKTPVSAQAFGNPQYNLGYQFKDKAVFFTTAQTETTYEHPAAKSMNQTSPVLVIYYTRAQAEKLVELFSQDFLHTLMLPAATGGTGVNAKGMDEYVEF